MTYLEAVELVKDIESKYDVMSIRYKGMSVWPYLRLYLLDQISVKKEHMLSCSIIKVVIKSLFFYNPLKIFKHHDLWIFTGCERRKQIGDKMIHRISGGISSCNNDCIMIEKPGLKKGHYNHELIEEKDIVSESWLLILFHLIERILRISKPIIENEDEMRKILTDNGLTFDYLHYVRMLNAKCLSLSLLLAIVKKPRLVMMECPYDSMGYMWACHQKGITFLELQHGVIGASHNAYNARYYEQRMQPDGICVFGSEEYRYFTEKVPLYTKNVYMTGLYMLEKADEFFTEDIFGKDRENYSQVIVVSGQKGYEQQLAEWIDKIAIDHNEILFVYIPRMSDEVLHFTCDNVRIARDVNIYEYLKWADMHITISSTTCLEGQYFATPTIFYDYGDRASTYYGQLLKEENGVVYIKNVDEFDRAYNTIKNGKFDYKEVFVHNHVDKIDKVIKNYIK